MPYESRWTANNQEGINIGMRRSEAKKRRLFYDMTQIAACIGI
jgi:hypothetical protein